MRAERQEADTDSAGRSSRHPVFSCQLETADGIHAPASAFLVGAIYMAEDETTIRFLFSCELFRGDAWRDGKWQAVIRGKRLKSIYDQLCEFKRISVKVTEGDVPEPKPVVTSVEILEMGAGI